MLIDNFCDYSYSIARVGEAFFRTENSESEIYTMKNLRSQTVS